jgi:O-antigen ligase
MITSNLIFIWNKLWVRLVALSIIFCAFIAFTFNLSTRITEDMKGLSKYDEPLIGILEENGVTQRMWLINEALLQIKENPWLGHGLRSQRKLFSWKIHKKGLAEQQSFTYREAAWKVSKLNLHNQYLQVFYEGGIFGLVLFIFPLAIILYLAFKKKNGSFLIPYIIFLLILITENLLDRQMGIYYFAVFLPLLYLAKEKPIHSLRIKHNKYKLK